MKAQPFLITSLPHSRTAWMAAFMSNGPSFCRYETVSELAQIEDLHQFFVDYDHRYIGVSDCALAWFLPWIMANIVPRTVIIERSVEDVDNALAKMGVARTNYCTLQIERLRAFRHHPQVMWVPYERLDDESTAVSMQEWLTPGTQFDAKRYAMLKEMHIEVDVDATMDKVRQRKANFDSIMREVTPLIKPLRAAA